MYRLRKHAVDRKLENTSFVHTAVREQGVQQMKRSLRLQRLNATYYIINRVTYFDHSWDFRIAFELIISLFLFFLHCRIRNSKIAFKEPSHGSLLVNLLGVYLHSPFFFIEAVVLRLK